MNLTRRSFVHLATAAAAVGQAAGQTSDPAHAAAQRQPQQTSPHARPRNLVLIICDDLGWGDLGCYGSKLPTPNLDKLARQGIRCTRYNSAHPICSASRAALMTGRYAQRSHTKSVYFPGSDDGMATDETTLGNLFHDAKFRTKAVGKWHLGEKPRFLPTSRGFDSYLGIPYSVDMHPLPLLRDTTVVEPNADPATLTATYTHEAVDFIRSSGKSPFFLYLAHSYPHDPACASTQFRETTRMGDYGDAVHEIDWSVGEVVKALEATGQLDETLILFTSDHGPWYQGSPGSLRGRKASTFEGGFRVPMIMHWRPGIQPAVCEEWLSSLDILPTVAQLFDLTPSSKPLDGIDIADVLLRGDKTPARKSLLYFSPSGPLGLNVNCIRSDFWKLRVAQHNGEIYINDYTSGEEHFWLPRAELYNLEQDPAEGYDVAAQHPEIVLRLLAELDSQIAGFPDDVCEAFDRLRKNVASDRTRPSAAPRPKVANAEG